jgi:hypothetical protein
MSTKKFNEVFAQEVDKISQRREKLNSQRPDNQKRQKIDPEQEDQKDDGTPIMRPTPASNVIGLSLSGGGIRSAAFCLGALQALDVRGIIQNIDYLSTVSGGGYIGTSMTAAMSAAGTNKFPFASELRTGEAPGVMHIRDHSNYLFPQGLLNVFGNIVVYLRGIIANVMLLLPYLLLAAALTIWWLPNTDRLMQTRAGYLAYLPISSVDYFGLTLNALLAFTIALAVWALWRSTSFGRDFTDVGISVRFFGIALAAILVVAFCELSPFFLSGFFAVHGSANGSHEILAAFMHRLDRLTPYLASIGAVVGFLGRFLSDWFKRATEKPGIAAAATQIAVKLAMYVAGATLPLVLWMAYLNLAFWGIRDCGTDCKSSTGPALFHAPDWMTSLANWIPAWIPGDNHILWLYLAIGVPMAVIGWTLSPNANSLHRLYRDRLSKAFLFNPAERIAWHKWDAHPDPQSRKADTGGPSGANANSTEASPVDTAKRIVGNELSPESAPQLREADTGGPSGANTNSAKAFLVDTVKRITANAVGPESAPQLRDSDLLPLDDFRISQLRTDLAPYHLINTALNIEASKYANRRDRNADFFIFSPLFTGSESTGYVATELMEGKRKRTELTLGTAVAVSGAAASSNMGSGTVKPLVPTLAILNIRLGYWIKNPKQVAGEQKKTGILRFFDKLYFLKEMLGLLTENSGTVYLTDGGHIENLGIYELLRRRCKLIIAIDAEQDPEMSFGSLITLERYARIDFGVQLDLPWSALRDATRAASAEILANGGIDRDKAARGPHCALGTIYYPRKRTGENNENDRTGVLLYIKSSFTGDESDYVVDYKRRHPAFPHESTADQLFSEEQFEAYRDIGFHAVNSAFRLTDMVCMTPKPVKWQGATTTLSLERKMRTILGWECREDVKGAGGGDLGSDES